jgi:predicted nucleic acid-binding protein
VTAIIVDTSAILAIFDESYAEHPDIARLLADAEDCS